MTFNIAVLGLWILRVRNMSTSIIEVCRHDMVGMFALLLAEKKSILNKKISPAIEGCVMSWTGNQIT